MDIKRLYEDFLEDVDEHRADILVGVGLASMAGAVVTAAIKAPQMKADMETMKQTLGVNKLPAKLVFKLIFKHLWPTIGLFAVGTACVIGGNRIQAGEISASAATIVGLETAANDIRTEYQAYREEAKQVLGEEKEQEVKVAAEQKVEALRSVNQWYQTGFGPDHFVEVVTGRGFDSNKSAIYDAYLEARENVMNGRDAKVTMNDIFGNMRLPETAMGGCDGWTDYDIKTSGIQPVFTPIYDRWTGDLLYTEVRPYPWPKRLEEK